MIKEKPRRILSAERDLRHCSLHGTLRLQKCLFLHIILREKPMSNTENISLQLARRQKRLLYWKDRLAANQLPQEYAVKCKELFSTYSLLLVRMTKQLSADEFTECESRLEAIEQELTNLFSSHRLLTSPLGSAITEEPESGQAGH